MKRQPTKNVRRSVSPGRASSHKNAKTASASALTQRPAKKKGVTRSALTQPSPGAARFLQPTFRTPMSILELTRVVKKRTSAINEYAGTARIIARSNAALAAGLDLELPAAVAEAIINGESAMRAIRKWRDLTQPQLSAASGVDQGTISGMERDGGGPVKNWRAVSRALRVPLDLIVPDED